MLILLMVSCSTATKNTQLPSEREVEESLASLSKEALKPVNFGPSLSETGNRFVDKTSEYGLDGVEAINFALVDLNRDNYPDLVIMPHYFSQPRFFIFDPEKKRFSESSHNPFPEVLQASFLSFADFNNDGVTDVVLGVLNQRGEFSKVPVTLWVGAWDREQRLVFKKDEKFLNLPAEPTSSIVIVDVNLDGRLDLFIGNWYQEYKKNLLPTADRLLINLKEKWVDQSDLLVGERNKSPDDIYPPHAKPTYAASSCDIDQDGWPDILTASAAGHYNKLWMNRLRSSNDMRFFEDIGKDASYAADSNGLLVPTGGGRTFSTVCADYNDDGIMDIFLGELSHGWDNLGSDRSSVLTGSRPTYPPYFLRTEYMSDAAADNWSQGDKRAQWADINLDGLVDLIVDNSGFPPASRLVAFAQDETRAFLNVAHQWGLDIVNPTGTVVADFNQDGKLDILTSQTNIRKASITNRVYLLENQLNLPNRRSIVFHLEGKESNPEGLGSMVMLYVEKDGKRSVQRRWYERVQGGIPSQLAPGVHFGLDAGAKVMGVKVRWPTPIKTSMKKGKVLERLYKLNDDAKDSNQFMTLCESGQVRNGRFSCAN